MTDRQQIGLFTNTNCIFLPKDFAFMEEKVAFSVSIKLQEETIQINHLTADGL